MCRPMAEPSELYLLRLPAAEWLKNTRAGSTCHAQASVQLTMHDVHSRRRLVIIPPISCPNQLKASLLPGTFVLGDITGRLCAGRQLEGLCEPPRVPIHSVKVG
jgi:hypothetical protein